MDRAVKKGLVSICIPAYNAESSIGETLESALAQTYANIEIIVSDNASTDRTGEIVGGYMQADPRIRYFRNGTNLGMVRNWNAAIRQAEGEFVKLLCADDTLAPRCIELQVAAFHEHPGAVLVTNNIKIIDSNSKIVGSRKNARKTKVVSGKSLARESFIRKNIVGEPSCVLARVGALIDAGLFDERFSYLPDWDLWLKVLPRGDAVMLAEFLSSYRVAKTSMTHLLAKRAKGAIMADDRLLIENQRALGAISLSPLDLLAHKANFRLRNAARNAFYLLFVR